MKHLPFGLRTLKTAISITVALIIVQLYSDNPDAMFYAALGALVAMETTLDRSIRQSITQLLSVLFGTVVGYLVLYLFHASIPAWVIGLGILILILLCNMLKFPYTITLSCIVFLSACMYNSHSKDLLGDAALRMANTTVGLATAMLVNIAIRPYNNKGRILSLLKKIRKQVPKDLESIVVYERFPNLQPSVELLRSIERELSLYHAQRFFHRKHDEEALLGGCLQLAQRMVQELEAICGMDCLGDLASDNLERMDALMLRLPRDGILNRKCTRRDTIVMNYHLDKLLTAHSYLGELMESCE
ncbi:MAG: hypothetical protein E7467_06920 [Ruminococcaceae bacterium]|nr:hypothetical protein [Oscillospiraceae bacterium]